MFDFLKPKKPVSPRDQISHTRGQVAELTEVVRALSAQMREAMKLDSQREKALKARIEELEAENARLRAANPGTLETP